jgi:hypothetical protein
VIGATAPEGFMKRMRSRRAKIVGWTSIALVAILVVITAGVFAAVRLELLRHHACEQDRQSPAATAI